MYIQVRIKSNVDVVKNGFKFIAKDDGYAYCRIFKKQLIYIQKIIENIEQKEYQEPQKQTRKRIFKED